MARAQARCSFQRACVGLIAATAGRVASVQGAEVTCRVVSRNASKVKISDGVSNALIEITDSICRDAMGAPQVVQINERIESVATAMAAAVAEVAVSCSGTGEAVLTVDGTTDAKVRAEAFGKASARIVAESGVCGLCESIVDSFATSMETVSVTATARLEVEQERIQFRNEPLSTTFVEEVMADAAIDVIGSIVGELRSDYIDGCSADVVIRSVTNNTVAECETSITVNDVITEMDAEADANLSVQAIGCGEENAVTADVSVREIAVAVAQAVSAANVFCNSTQSDNAGSGAMACGLTSGSVEAIARARVTALASGLVEAIGEECDCSLSTAFNLDEMAYVTAVSASGAFAEVCVNGTEYAISSEFETQIEERLGEALANVRLGASAGDYAECDLFFSAFADVQNITDNESA